MDCSTGEFKLCFPVSVIHSSTEGEKRIPLLEHFKVFRKGDYTELYFPSVSFTPPQSLEVLEVKNQEILQEESEVKEVLSEHNKEIIEYTHDKEQYSEPFMQNQSEVKIDIKQQSHSVNEEERYEVSSQPWNSQNKNYQSEVIDYKEPVLSVNAPAYVQRRHSFVIPIISIEEESIRQTYKAQYKKNKNKAKRVADKWNIGFEISVYDQISNVSDLIPLMPNYYFYLQYVDDYYIQPLYYPKINSFPTNSAKYG